MAERDEVEGLVLSGGGAFAAYEVGVLKGLLCGESPASGHRPLDPKVVTGTSSGAFNGAMLVSRWRMTLPEAIAGDGARLVRSVPGDIVHCDANGIFRWRVNPFNFLDFRCLLADPLRFLRNRAEDTAYLTRDFLQRAVAFARSDSPLEQRFLELLDLTPLISSQPFPELLDRAVDFVEIGSSPQVLRLITTNWETGELQEFGNAELAGGDGALIIMASGAIPGFFRPCASRPGCLSTAAC